MDNIRYFKLLYDEKDFVANTAKETVFLIAILQFDWIDEFNVFLDTDGKRIYSKYVETTYLPDELPADELDKYNHLYSIFRCTHHYTHPCDNMEAHWHFRVREKQFCTESMHFKVL